MNLKAVAASLALLAVAGFLYIFWSGGGQGYAEDGADLPSLAETGQKISLEMGASPRCVSDGAGVFLLLSDGVRRYDNAGKLEWDYPLSLSNPVFVSAGAFVAAGEYKGSILNVFGPSGLSYTVNLENEILNFNIGANGFTAVTTSSPSGGYNINVYNAQGSRITYSIVEVKNVYPIYSALSPDGRILAVSFLNLGGSQIESYICAYYLKQADSIDYTDGMFASFHRTDGEIISKVEFIDNDYLMFLSDGQYGVYELSGSQMKLKWLRELNNEVSLADVAPNRGVAIAMGKSLVNKDGVAEGTVTVLDTAGKELCVYTIEGPATYLHCGKEAIIVGGGPLGREFAAISYKNKILWEYKATADVLDFVTLDKPENALVVTANSITIMEKRKNTGGPIQEPVNEADPAFPENFPADGLPELNIPDIAPESTDEQLGNPPDSTDSQPGEENEPPAA